MDTKQKILYAALDLFSQKGYEAVSVRDIARAVGVKESSLYNHFQNKRDIYRSILDFCAQKGGEIGRSLDLTDEKNCYVVDTHIRGLYRNTTPEQFAHMAETLFDYYFMDDLNVKLRKMLTIEQYRDREAEKRYRENAFDAALTYQTELFAALMEEGLFRRTDPYMLALAFYSPIFLLFYKFDATPEGHAEAKVQFLRHIDHFVRTYAVSGTEGEEEK
ncbi:MAG TPA: TetR/AcrR family transcriptional regulator [Feifaniaceae bacterium]|nr:TetR/AcrR family transcriptional regulator [Feifaniaceae bacterium]